MWKRHKINLPVNPKELRPVLNDTIRPIVTSLRSVQEALELVQRLLLDYDEPVFSRLARALKDQLISISNTGIYVCPVISNIDKVMSTEECLTLLAESVIDVYDPNVPILNSTADVDLTLVALESGTLGGIVEIMELLEKLVYIPKIYYDYLFDQYVPVGEDYNIIYGQGQYPDWYAGNLFDLFPFLSDAAEAISKTLDLFIVPSRSDTFGLAAALLSEKIDILERLINQLEVLVDTYLAIGNIGDLMIYNIRANVDRAGLRGLILQARSELYQLRLERSGIIVNRETSNTSILTEVKHREEGVNVGAVIALALNTPDNTILADVFGG